MGKLTEHLKQEIADSFPSEYAQFDLGLTLPMSDWEVFDKGIFSTSMDEKWNVFSFAGELYWARSWTNHCVFKIFVDKRQVLYGRPESWKIKPFSRLRTEKSHHRIPYFYPEFCTYESIPMDKRGL